MKTVKKKPNYSGQKKQDRDFFKELLEKLADGGDSKAIESLEKFKKSNDIFYQMDVVLKNQLNMVKITAAWLVFFIIFIISGLFINGFLWLKILVPLLSFFVAAFSHSKSKKLNNRFLVLAKEIEDLYGFDGSPSEKKDS